ncbi:MAG: hypothetical protein OEY17_06320, partial [Nitrosopumilus sp.]|nr:hypothetical protein [Nitrosopumilus sp.]
MKSRHLSVVFLLIVFAGATIGSTAFAESDVIEDFEDCVAAGGVTGENPYECTIDGAVFVNDEDDDEKVLICHKDQKTLSIDSNALRAHLTHGDYEGHCDVDARATFMRGEMHDKDHDKTMMMDKHDILDAIQNEIRMKYVEKYGDLDKKKSELKIKFNEHMKEMKNKISDERKSSIHHRLAEMKAFKAELREHASDMTYEEKQQLRENFIEKVKEMQLAWISPRTQITAGVDATEVVCREGFSLVMKASNGVPMCLKV